MELTARRQDMRISASHECEGYGPRSQANSGGTTAPVRCVSASRVSSNSRVNEQIAGRTLVLQLLRSVAGLASFSSSSSLRPAIRSTAFHIARRLAAFFCFCHDYASFPATRPSGSDRQPSPPLPDQMSMGRCASIWALKKKTFGAWTMRTPLLCRRCIARFERRRPLGIVGSVRGDAPWRFLVARCPVD